VLDGDDAYLRALDDVHDATRTPGAEVLFFCSDDRATRPGEHEAEQRISAACQRTALAALAVGRAIGRTVPAASEQPPHTRLISGLPHGGDDDDQKRALQFPDTKNTAR
jgi:hypothetical protein